MDYFKENSLFLLADKTIDDDLNLTLQAIHVGNTFKVEDSNQQSETL